MGKEKSIKLKEKKNNKSKAISKSISNNSNLSNDKLSLNLTRADITFTRNTLNNLNHLLYDETARKIFIEFSELEHSHNHILFWLEANEFKEKYINIKSFDKSLKPEKQDQQQTSNIPIELPVKQQQEILNNNVQTPNSAHVENSKEGADQQQQEEEEQEESQDKQETSENNNISSSGLKLSSSGNKVSRESSNSNSGESDDEEDENSIALKSNMKNALYIFDKYLTPSSALEVNLDFKTYIDIKKKIECDQVPLNIFDKSQKEIFEVIFNDSFFRFKSSSTFKYLLACTENNELSNSTSKSIKSTPKSHKQGCFCF